MKNNTKQYIKNKIIKKTKIKIFDYINRALITITLIAIIIIAYSLYVDSSNKIIKQNNITIPFIEKMINNNIFNKSLIKLNIKKVI